MALNAWWVFQALVSTDVVLSNDEFWGTQTLEATIGTAPSPCLELGSKSKLCADVLGGILHGATDHNAIAHIDGIRHEATSTRSITQAW